MTAIHIRAPASSANLGAAFDCAALAVSLYNDVGAELAAEDRVTVRGEGAAALRGGAPNLVLRACDRLLATAGQARPPLALHLENGIPFGRGLGSSAAAIAAGLRLGEALSGVALPEEDVLLMAAELEGHADNTTAALLGGCTLCVLASGRPIAVRLPVPAGLRVVVFVPEYAVATERARAVLPVQLPRADAVFNTGRAALLAAAFALDRLDLLATATEDRLHQPYRFPLYRAMEPLLAAARAAGAYGAAVSGAGPTAAAFTSAATAGAVAAAFEHSAAHHGVAGQALTLEPDLSGAHVLG